MADSEAKRAWMRENSVMIPLKVMKRTESDILDFLESETKRTGMARNAIIKTALREYMERHNMRGENTMKKIINFDSAPEYIFGDDERENTVLVWPDSVPGMDFCFRCREAMESGEIIEYRIYGYDMPTNSEE